MFAIGGLYVLHPHADGPSPEYSTKHKSEFPQPGPPEPRATAEISIGMCQRQRHYTNWMHPFSQFARFKGPRAFLIVAVV